MSALSNQTVKSSRWQPIVSDQCHKIQHDLLLRSSYWASTLCVRAPVCMKRCLSLFYSFA